MFWGLEMACAAMAWRQPVTPTVMRLWSHVLWLQFRRGCILWWLIVVLRLPECSCCRIQMCGLKAPARDLYSLFASVKQTFLSISFHLYRFTKRISKRPGCTVLWPCHNMSHFKAPKQKIIKPEHWSQDRTGPFLNLFSTSSSDTSNGAEIILRGFI